jgi:hypothetical protein
MALKIACVKTPCIGNVYISVVMSITGNYTDKSVIYLRLSHTAASSSEWAASNDRVMSDWREMKPDTAQATEHPVVYVKGLKNITP